MSQIRGGVDDQLGRLDVGRRVDPSDTPDIASKRAFKDDGNSVSTLACGALAYMADGSVTRANRGLLERCDELKEDETR